MWDHLRVIKDWGLGWLVVIKGMISVFFPIFKWIRKRGEKWAAAVMGITSCLCPDLVLIGRIF